MKNAVFLDIDTQEDYMSNTSDSYVHGAEEIIPNLSAITKFAKRNNIRVIASVDKNTKGKKSDAIKFNSKIKETMLDFMKVKDKKLSKNKIRELLDKNVLIEKQGYSAFSNKNLHRLINDSKRAYVYGVATDYCIKAAVFDLLSLKIKTFVIRDAIKGSSKENEEKSLDIFQRRGVKFLTTRQLLGRKVL